MMNLESPTENPLVTCLIGISVGMIIGAALAASAVQSAAYFDAAQTDCAQFNPTTGTFEWIPEVLEIPGFK